MSDLPRFVEILEEGPREGFQAEPPGIPVAAKLELIEALAETGLAEINCASFVSRKVMPQMADAEEIAATVHRKEGVRYRGMWLSKNGFLRAANSGLDLMATLSASASDTFLFKNNNRTPEQYLAEQEQMLDLFEAHGLKNGPVYIFTAFGCNYEGAIDPARVVERTAPLLDLLAARGHTPSHVTLCDTIGSATPEAVRRAMGAVRERWPDQPIALHLHDTRGLGLACALAGLEMGASRFDASVGGLGGCPFAGNAAAAGNIATEELVLLCESMGLATGIDLARLVEVVALAERIVGRPLPSRLAKAGLFQPNPARA
ncbi:hydroxymethylglutaryl-CoA lyase [Novosphingobium mangrovi (ex Hu et al. 2023)]|uniref:Hydroxymethylglutaryl-CoA lyase n=1 Tax=Novosphingobium mangrovi (ex Hu et al. 2023) TaxID=2930094 RepID=A0ABT0AEJ4_9SPHN|nr:hydroxymethylglutaryl-CoA lyase [Novosphingobium mangrovi (ex Hu et al. 2023)]MCJ1961595.1 hydroxymethylglutaryl-CoA lyase [Novosphingobium mangrovi (ex Hu et al. 2023)]